MMKTRDEIIAAHPLVEYLRTAGVKLAGSGKKLRAERCPTRSHSRDDAVAIDAEKQVFKCFVCDTGGSVIDWIALEKGKPAAEVLKELGANGSNGSSGNHAVKSVLVKSYYYRNANGDKIYKVCRYEPKTFRPFHIDAEGKAVPGLEGVTRVLYNLPEILEADTVIVVEGEKDADALNELQIGAVATTNCQGAESWLDSYADTLAGKQVVVMPDQDEKGEKHAGKVIASVMGKAKTIQRVNVPKPHKDVADFIAAVGAEKAKEELIKRITSAKVLKPGHDLPFKDIHDLEHDYRQHVSLLESRSINLSKWLPSLSCLRKLTPGDMVAFLADTGSGKTAWLVNLIRNANPIPTLSFELELGEAMVFERFIQSEMGCTGLDIERAYSEGKPPAWKQLHSLNHFLHCTETRLTPDRIEELIEKAELRLGQRPVLVTIDYIGLLDDVGGDRYERLSNIAEKLRLIAKRTQTVIVIASQVKRKTESDNTTPIGLHDAKNTGSIENSASIVIGAWRDKNDSELLHLQVLKASRGGAGKTVQCNFHGVRMQITERTP